MSSLNILDCFSQVNSKYEILNNEEYAYITGSIIIIKKFKSALSLSQSNTESNRIKYLQSQNSGFSSFAYNKKYGIFITAEDGIDTIITIYYYNKLTTEDNGFYKISSFKIEQSLSAEAVDITREGNLLGILFNEPLMELRLYDISNILEYIKENINKEEEIQSALFKFRAYEESEFYCSDQKSRIVINIKISQIYKKIQFNPLCDNNTTSILLFSRNELAYIEVTDSFPKNYQTDFMNLNNEVNENMNFNIHQDLQIRKNEEEKITKKYLIYNRKFDKEVYDFCWDSYSNVYVACSTSQIYLFNNKLESITQTFKEETRHFIQLNERPICLLYTQRYLLTLTDEGRLIYINPYIPSNELILYKSMLGEEDKYQVFNIEREYIINNLGDPTSMKYDTKFSKIYITTMEGVFKWISLQAEGLIKDKEMEKEKEDMKNLLVETEHSSELEAYEENKSHLYDIEQPNSNDNYLNKVIGIKEIPNTTQLISIADDQNLIFWELAEKSAKSIHYLDFTPSCFEIDKEGQLLVVGSEMGVLRIYDISQKYVLRLIHQTKYLTRKMNQLIDKIFIQEKNKYIGFCNLNDNLIHFISGEVNTNFTYLGFISTPMLILDISLIINEKYREVLLVLSKQVLFAYEINHNSFIYDQKNGIKISNKKNYNIMNNFEISFDVKAKKIDSDLKFIIKNINNDDPSTSIWLVGEDKYFRQYSIPVDDIESIRDNKKSPDKPNDEIKAHELNVTDAFLFNNNMIISASEDGTVQIRVNNNVTHEFRTHTFLKMGVSTLSLSSKKNYIYVGGEDGSIFILGININSQLPSEIENRLSNNEDLDIADVVDYIKDEGMKSLEEHLHMEYVKLIKSNKRVLQSHLKEKIDSIKSELNRLIVENNKEEEIERLQPEEMIIHDERIEKEKEEGRILGNNLNIRLFFELSEKEVIKKKLYENTFEKMTIRTGQDRIINNNLRVFTNLNGDKELKSYALRKFNDEEKNFINHAKQLRIIELQDKYKRRDNGIPDLLDEKKFTNMNEEYLVNRISSQIELKETEINPSDIADNDGESGIKDDKAKYKAAKYKLQKDPYESFGVKNNKQDENIESVVYKAEEQLLKEDLSVKYKTIAAQIQDIDIKIGYKDIDTFSMLYSPFELYSKFRMRTQIYLILDIIQQLKYNFNKELSSFYENRLALISKFNSNKQYLIENLSDVLTGNIEEEYQIHESPYADNDWVNKFSEQEVTIPKYFSKEEKEQLEHEEKIRQERLKALQGDTFEMRGLKTMIAPQIKKKNENMIDEEELIREAWMDKDNTKWTEDEIKRYNEYLRKEKEIQDKKEKIKSQKITKMNNIKMDLDNLKADMESKFLKMIKKKLYYDYKITEQEIYILSLLKIQEYRSSIKSKKMDVNESMQLVKKEKELFERIKRLFDENFKEFNDRMKEIEMKFAEKNKIKFDDNQTDNKLTKEEIEYLKEIRLDPYYFEIKKRMENIKKNGEKKYPEFIKPNVKEDIVQLRNMNLYYSYKKQKFLDHQEFLKGQFENIELTYKKLERLNNDYLDNEDKKLKLNFDVLIRINRSQDEITDENGPQKYVDQALLIDKFLIDNQNKIIKTLYSKYVDKKNLNLMNKGTEIENSLELSIINLRKYDIELKSRYLKLTRVTKKIQEIVIGREDVNQKHIIEAYEQKKRNLDDTKKKKLKDIEDNLLKMKVDIEKKKTENILFTQKYDKLLENVKLKKAIVDLDNNDDDDDLNEDTDKLDDSDENVNDNKAKHKDFVGGNNKHSKKAKELAQVTRLKNLIQNYYEEIEYLRSELDKLRARTFPSFLQKPDQVIYPDEK